MNPDPKDQQVGFDPRLDSLSNAVMAVVHAFGMRLSIRQVDAVSVLAGLAGSLAAHIEDAQRDDNARTFMREALAENVRRNFEQGKADYRARVAEEEARGAQKH